MFLTQSFQGEGRDESDSRNRRTDDREAPDGSRRAFDDNRRFTPHVSRRAISDDDLDDDFEDIDDDDGFDPDDEEFDLAEDDAFDDDADDWDDDQDRGRAIDKAAQHAPVVGPIRTTAPLAG